MSTVYKNHTIERRKKAKGRKGELVVKQKGSSEEIVVSYVKGNNLSRQEAVKKAKRLIDEKGS